MPFLLAAIVTLFVSVLAFSSALAECLVASPPPKLVPCKTEETCDRNPEHLIKYVEQFYAWYISSEEEWRQSDEPCEKTEKESSKLYGFIQDTIQQHLTTRFWKYRDQANTENPVWDRDFCPTESDSLICAQDHYLEDWYPRRPVQIVKMNKDEIILSTSKIHNQQLFIALKPENDVWRFDSVKE